MSGSTLERIGIPEFTECRRYVRDQRVPIMGWIHAVSNCDVPSSRATLNMK